MIINNIEIDPGANPAVLNTLTWDTDQALAQVKDAGDDLSVLERCVMSSGGNVDSLKSILAGAVTRSLRFAPESAALAQGAGYLLVRLPDNQRVLFSASIAGKRPPFAVVGEVRTGLVKGYISPVDVESVPVFLKSINSSCAPSPAGTQPRLGVGNRQTTTVWPGIFKAMRDLGGPGEIIQNSAYRELAPQSFILAPPSPEAAYLPGHGSLNIGHTGSSIEGLWLQGAVAALENGFTTPYGADLDHIPVRGLDEESLAFSKNLITLGRHYTFFTIDASALFHLDRPDLEGRYGEAVEAAAILYDHIRTLKGGEEFDFEFSLDEGPSITEPEEQEYVLKSLTDRGVRVHFIAPNVGFEKRLDYRRSDGLDALDQRVRVLSQQADHFGAVLDFHSGSDKSRQTYRTISRACEGRLKLKVSGKLQLILSEVLADLNPEFFNFWWDWTLETAENEAQQGSEVAAEYVQIVRSRMQAEGSGFTRSPADRFFTDFSFAMVGAKDADGRFLYRDQFYSFSPEVQSEYESRTKSYVLQLADDLNLY